MERVPRILIADDDRGIRDALTDLLGEEGFQVVGTAEDGLEAIDLVAELEPDIVLMDLRMPRMNGIDATRLIRDSHPLIQVIFLSAYDDEALTRGADEAGAYAYLVKGCSAALIRDVVLKSFGLKLGLEERETPRGA